MTESKSSLDAVLPGRHAGVLAHVTSIPGGTIGARAHHYIDWVADAGLSVWQMLPVAPVNTSDRSPYGALSALAGEPGLIEFEDQHGVSVAEPCERAARWLRNNDEVALAQTRERFEEENRHWLPDWALFSAIKDSQNGRPWWEWPEGLRSREAGAVANAAANLADAIARKRLEQFVFEQQWDAMHAHARERGVSLFGDLPIFVALDSADVWANRELFELDASGNPISVAGVPPDAFSATGQRWGNPLYDWQRMAEDGFAWWVVRLRNAFSRFDIVRLDHFRGFEAYWRIPATEPTAVKGEWVDGPGRQLFDAVHKALGSQALVAEDLGFITPEVHELRAMLGFPGMAVLQFAFDGGDDNPYLPQTIQANSVVYTGTHDNDTTLGWYQSLEDWTRHRANEIAGGNMPWDLIDVALKSNGRLAVVPMQDWLGLGQGHRMNTPGVAHGNWLWTFDWNDVPTDLPGRIRGMLDGAGRLGSRNG